MEQPERSAFSSSIAGKAVRAAFDGGRLTSDAGVLVLADIERRLGIAERLARCRLPLPGQPHAARPPGRETALRRGAARPDRARPPQPTSPDVRAAGATAPHVAAVLLRPGHSAR